MATTDTKSISLSAIPEEVKFSEVYNSNYKVIKLETTNESLFAIPTKTRLTEQYIFILDQTKKKFLIFDKDGNFIRNLNKLGKGPEEYLNIADFTLDETKKIIYIYDDMQKKIISYDFELNFLTKRIAPFYFSKFECLSNGNFVFYTGLMAAQENKFRYDIIITDNNLKIINKFFPYQYTNAIRGHQDKLFKVNNSDTIYFYTNYSNVVYKIVNTKIIPKYEITNFNGHELPSQNFYLKERKAGKGNSKVAKDIFSSKLIYSYMFFKDANKLILFFNTERTSYVSLFDFQTKRQWHTSKLIDDFGLALNLEFSKPRFFHNNKLGYYIFPYLALEDKEKNTDKYINPLVSDMKIEDNPIIVLFTLK